MNPLNLINSVDLIKAILNWLQKPLPEICFEYKLSRGNEENDYCQFRINRLSQKESLFFRLGVNNNGKTRIEDADMRIEKIEKVDARGNKQKISSSPFFLHWANETTDNSRSIYFKTPVFIDILYTVKGESVAYFYPKEKHFGAGIKTCITPGSWILTIKLLGANITPIEKKVKVDFNGKWDQLKISFI